MKEIIGTKGCIWLRRLSADRTIFASKEPGRANKGFRVRQIQGLFRSYF